MFHICIFSFKITISNIEKNSDHVIMKSKSQPSDVIEILNKNFKEISILNNAATGLSGALKMKARATQNAPPDAKMSVRSSPRCLANSLGVAI